MQTQETPFVVEFVGMDGWYHALGCITLDSAQHEAVWLEERGCHSISIVDEDGEECSRFN